MHAHNKRFFYIRRSAGPCGKSDQGRQLPLVFFFQRCQSVPDVVYQLVGISDADMYRCIYADGASAGLCSTHNDAACPCHQQLAGGDSRVTVL